MNPFPHLTLKGKQYSANKPPENFVDVRDCARLHVAAVLDPSVKDQRIYGVADTLAWTEVVTSLRKMRPQNKKYTRLFAYRLAGSHHFCKKG
jgi:hypothetical protein